ncbi:MAG: hypothetical protein AB1545_12195 [Thermodesulfobacteriota bacterium]
MKKTRKIYLATTLVALALAGGQSVYAKAQNADEDVHNWGPWDKMVSPAAGPEAVNLNPLAFALPNDYEEERDVIDIRPEPPVPPEPPPPPPPVVGLVCPDGALCGYGQTSEWSYNNDYSQESYDGGEGPMKPWQVALVVDKNGDPSATDWSADKFPDAYNYYNDTQYWRYSLSGSYDYGYPDPNGVISLLAMNLRDESTQKTGTMPFYYPPDVNFPEEGATGYSNYYIENWTNVVWDVEGGERSENIWLEVNLVPVLGEESGIYYVWYGQSSYATTRVDCEEGDEGCYDSQTREQMYGQFIVGTPTTLAQMNTQIDERVNAGNVIANYRGQSASWSGSQDVRIRVNFGNSTWTGTWNGGADGDTWVDKSNNHVYNEVGFKAKGDVLGNTFVSNSLSALDGTVTGKVQGAFFNPKANVVVGVVDIVKSRTDGTYTKAPHVSTFAAMEGYVRPEVLR